MPFAINNLIYFFLNMHTFKCNSNNFMVGNAKENAGGEK